MNATIQNIHPNVVGKFTLYKKAEQAAEQLSHDGFEVIAVNLSTKKPVIWIANSVLCKKLKGTSAACKKTARGKLQVFAAPYQGCQVQWQVVGN